MRLLIATILFLPFGVANADPPAPAPPPRHHHTPPKEAFDACANKAKADTCGFTIHNHDLTGTCLPAPPESKTLACKPDHPPPHSDPPPAK
jgi:hypothetical protein